MKIFPCVIGLGYVGLPVFLRLQSKFKTAGFDINKSRIKFLKKKIDVNNELNHQQLVLKNNSFLTENIKDIEKCNFFIVTVPTPVFKNNLPNLLPLISASKVISSILKKKDIVFYESTVYPGITDYLTVNFLEKSNFKNNIDFFVGYSPERINPGDKKHSIDNISKIVACNTNDKEIIKIIFKIYRQICKKVFFTKKINEAELAKALENTQRDLNIALMNEMFIFCEKFKLDFKLVRDLAATKWNFINFSPGLVGGHCLPVDPYYITYLAKKNDLELKTIVAARSVNNYMYVFIKKYLAERLIKLGKTIYNSKILIAGLTYKENVSDMRNSISLKIFNSLLKNNKNVYGLDHFISSNFIKKNKNILKNYNNKRFDAIIFLVKHDKFKSLYEVLKNKNLLILDPFSFFTKNY
jgi:UDP-N-acetyl-D-galactosamine dehydrogenase